MDSAHPQKEWVWQLTQVYQDATGGIRETLGAIPIFSFSGRFPLYTDRPARLSWAVDGAAPSGATVLYRNMYRGRSGLYGFVGQISSAAAPFIFKDDGQAPDYSHQPPVGTNPFTIISGGSQNPSVVSFFEQRLFFARSDLAPQTFWGSAVGNAFNFDRPSILIDSSSIIFTLASVKREEIRSMVSMRALMMFTQSGVWAVRGAVGAPLTPSSIDAKDHEIHGSSWVTPVTIGVQVIYVQEKGDRVRAVNYDVFRDMYNSSEMSTYALHYFEGFNIQEMVFQSVPFKCIWFARSDGNLIGVTYSMEQEMIAWHQHPMTNGFVENVCVVSEPPEDALYMVVRRVINGVARRFVERMSTRLVMDVRLGNFLDCSLQFDGRNISATTMRLSATNYTGGGNGTVTASVATFVAGDVGSIIVLDPDGLSGGPFRLTVLSFTSSTVVGVSIDVPVLVAFQNIATTSWAWARQNFTGLFQLAGQTIGVLGDSNDLGQVVVDSTGAFVAPIPCVIIQAGLPYNSDLETLNFFIPGGTEVRSLQKTIKRIFIEVDSTRGLFAGSTFSNLVELKQRQVSDNWGNIMPQTFDAEIFVAGAWEKDARVVIRQSAPLPIGIVGISREVEFGGT